MEQRLTKIFKQAKYEPSTDLAGDVWGRIVKREKYISRFKLIVFVFVGVASLAGLVPAFKILSSDLAQSGFYDYFSLIFSDSGSVVSYWKEFVFSLAEALPIMSIIFALSLVFIFFLSVRYLVKQIINNHGSFYGKYI